MLPLFLFVRERLPTKSLIVSILGVESVREEGWLVGWGGCIQSRRSRETGASTKLSILRVIIYIFA